MTPEFPMEYATLSTSIQSRLSANGLTIGGGIGNWAYTEPAMKSQMTRPVSIFLFIAFIPPFHASCQIIPFLKRHIIFGSIRCSSFAQGMGWVSRDPGSRDEPKDSEAGQYWRKTLRKD
jgi:hypothetical protein